MATLRDRRPAKNTNARGESRRLNSQFRRIATRLSGHGVAKSKTISRQLDAELRGRLHGGKRAVQARKVGKMHIRGGDLFPAVLELARRAAVGGERALESEVGRGAH